MIYIKVDTVNIPPKISPHQAVLGEISHFGMKLTDKLADRFKEAIEEVGAIGARSLFNSVRSEYISGIERYTGKVQAARHWIFVQDGRRAGAKMPPEDAPDLLAWFVLKGIPKRAWYAVRRKIAREGIKARDIQGIAVRKWKQDVPGIMKEFGTKVVIRLFTKG